ncbi:unnamed protein product [Psylliodes chrysocephalus]|uniref:Uncharacterized protein n=1 Tax=Psylliodes chrysocephalus TaxID=3402493 RepID=A0A9P0CGU3_9CUCU|nr:unnamed protein product [Psylliodes chrysocephala]
MAESELLVFTAELNKLKENELIDIILTQKMPASVSNVQLLKYVSGKSEKLINSDSDKLHASHVSITCEQCEKRMEKIEFMNSELNNVSKLSFHLEKRTQEQADLIFLLKQQHSSFNPNNSTTVPVTPSTSFENKPLYRNEKIPSSSINFDKNLDTNVGTSTTQQKLINRIQKTNNTNPEQKMIADKSTNNIDGNKKGHSVGNHLNFNKNRQTRLIGSNDAPTFKTIPRQGHVHVSRISADMSSADLINILNKTAPNIKFCSEEWNRTEKTSTYKVSFPLDNLNDVYIPTIWPKGAAVKRFHFKKNFLRGESTEQQT